MLSLWDCLYSSCIFGFVLAIVTNVATSPPRFASFFYGWPVAMLVIAPVVFEGLNFVPGLGESTLTASHPAFVAGVAAGA